MGQELGASRRGTGGDPRRRFRHLVTILCSMVLLVGAFVVSGVPLAGADPSIPNCSSGGYPCGYYISVNGTSELAGESTISPSVITTGTEVVQTATVETGPQSYTSGNISGTTGIYYVTITGLDGPLVSYSPQGGDGITTSVNGSQVTWGSSTPFSEGAVFTLTNTATTIGASCGGSPCVAQGTQWGSDGNINAPGFSFSQLVDTESGGSTPPTAGINYHPTGTTPNQWVFDGSPSIAGAGSSISSYAWNFGDGTTGSGETVTHKFASEGSRTVTLTVTDADGQHNTTSTTLSPALRIEQVVFDPTKVEANSSFPTKVTVENDGPVTVDGVVPYGSISPSEAARITGASSPASADLPPGMSQTYSVPTSAFGDNQATLTEAATGVTADSGHTTVTAPTVTRNFTVGNPGLTITVDAEAVQKNDDFSVKVTVTNPGTQDVSNLVWGDPSGLINETVNPANSYGPPATVATLLTGPDPAPPTSLASGEVQAFTYLFNASAQGLAVFTARAEGTLPDGTEIGGSAAETASISDPDAPSNIDNVVQQAMTGTNTVVASSVTSTQAILSNDIQTTIGTKAPSYDQQLAVQQAGLPPEFASLGNNTTVMDWFLDQYGKDADAELRADGNQLGKLITTVASVASDPVALRNVESQLYDYVKSLPPSVVQSLASNGSYLAQAVALTYSGQSAVPTLDQMAQQVQALPSTLQNELNIIADGETTLALQRQSLWKSNPQQYVRDVADISFDATKAAGSAELAVLVGEGGGKVVGAGLSQLKSLGGLAQVADTSEAITAAANTADPTLSAATGANDSLAAQADGAMNAYQKIPTGTSLTAANLTNEAGILPGDAQSLQNIIANVKEKFGVDLDVGVRTSEPLSAGIDGTPKPEIIKPKACSTMDLLLGCDPSQAGRAGVYDPVPLDPTTVAKMDEASPGFAAQYEARLSTQQKLWQDWQSGTSNLNQLVQGSAEATANGQQGITAIIARPGDPTVPFNIAYLEQLNDPAFLKANSQYFYTDGVVDPTKVDSYRSILSDYSDNITVNIKAVPNANGVSFVDGLTNKPYVSDLDLQFVAPADGQSYPAGQKGQIETYVMSQLRSTVERFPGHGWSTGTPDLTSKFADVGFSFDLGTTDPVNGPAKAASLYARLQAIKQDLLNQAILTVDPTQRQALINQANKLGSYTIDGILQKWPPGEKIIIFTAGDIRSGYTPLVAGHALTDQLRPRSAAPHATFDGVTPVTYTVNSTADSAPGGGVCASGSGGCSLREAFNEADAASTPVDITVPAGTYDVATPLSADGDITVTGSGEGATTVDAQQTGGVVNAEGGTLSLDGLTLTGGNDGGSLADGGGALYAYDTSVSLSQVAVTGNDSDGPGGGVSVWDGSLDVSASSFSDNAGQQGGAVYAANSALNVSGTSFTGDGGSMGGGAIFASYPTSFAVSGSSFTDETANGSGGAIYLEGAPNGATPPPFTIDSSTFSGNDAADDGGGLYVGDLTSSDGHGGSLAVTDSTFGTTDSVVTPSATRGSVVRPDDAPATGNTAAVGGGAAIDDGAVSFTDTDFGSDTAGDGGGGAIASSGALTIGGGTFSDNSSSTSGGALAVVGALHLTDTPTFSSNSAGGLGGALALTGDGPYTITSGHFEGNSSDVDGSAVWINGSNLSSRTAVTFGAGQSVDTTGLPPTSDAGYRTIGADGGVFAFGQDQFLGSAVGTLPDAVGGADTPDGQGYWIVAADGDVAAYGDATNYGSLRGTHLNQPIVGMAATPDGKGYWLVASDGGVFSYGDASFHGSAGDIRLNQPIVGMAATPDGGGYWLVASDGGVFSYGDASFQGSTGDIRLVKPIVSILAP